MLNISLRCIRIFHKFNSEKIRHYVLANVLCWFGVHLVIEKRFRQKHCVNYLSKIKYVLFQNFTSEKSRHYVLANLLCWFGVHLVIEHIFNQTQYLRYFNNIKSGYFII